MFRIILFILLNLNLFAYNILVIGSYHDSFSWQSDYNLGLIEVLPKAMYNFDYFNLDSKRLMPDEYEYRAKLAWEYYKKGSYDLVVLGDDNCLSLLHYRFSKTETPVVFLGINNNIRNYFDKKPKNITGVLERPIFGMNIYQMRLLINPLNKVLVLFDHSPTSQSVITESFIPYKSKKILGTEINFESTNDYSTWKNILLNAHDKYDAIILGTYQTLRDNSNTIVPETTVLSETSTLVKIPLFAFWEYAVGKGGAIGGYVLDAKDQGREAAYIIKEILEEGKSPSEIFPRTAKKGKYIFSTFELNRWDLVLPEELEKNSIIYE